MPTTRVRLIHLRAFRVAKLLTQCQLAVQAGLNKATIQSLESGEHLANFQTIHKLAKALNVEATALAWGPAPELVA